MHNILRLSVTLAAVAIISAALLTGMHNITEPVIREKEQREYLEALERFFPDINEYEAREIEGDQFDLVYDQDGEKLGIMATVKTQGYEGTITYNLAVDTDTEIIGIRVISHSETPGIGDVITTDDFQEQFIGKSFEDPIQEGEDVDAVSGATMSTGSMINSIRRTVITIGENILDMERKAFALEGLADGVYRGSVEGTYGPLTVEVELSDGRIQNIEVIEHNETEAYFVDAYPEIPEKIIEEQSLEVDVQTGATLSAERIITAVINALEDAPESGSGGGDN